MERRKETIDFEKLTEEVRGDMKSLLENQNAMSLQFEDLKLEHKALQASVKDLIAMQQAFRGTKTFIGWITDTVKYISYVGASFAVAWHFVIERLLSSRGPH